MTPIKNYKLADGTVRQYHEGMQPKGAVRVGTAAARQTPEKAAAKRTAKAKAAKAEA